MWANDKPENVKHGDIIKFIALHGREYGIRVTDIRRIDGYDVPVYRFKGQLLDIDTDYIRDMGYVECVYVTDEIVEVLE